MLVLTDFVDQNTQQTILNDCAVKKLKSRYDRQIRANDIEPNHKTETKTNLNFE